MKVVGIEPAPGYVRIVLVEGDATSFSVPNHEEWTLASAERCDDYVEIRQRLVERINKWSPEAVCIEPLEPMALRRGIKGASVQTAELRGVLAEAARAAGAKVEFPLKAAVNARIGARDADAYVKDDTEWAHLGTEFKKKFRTAAVVALSRVRST